MSNLRDHNDSRLGGFLIGLGTAAVLILLGGNIYLLTRQPSKVAGSDRITTALQPNTPIAPAEPTTPNLAASTDTTGLPMPQTLNLQQNHPNGSSMRLTGISFADDSITADLAITNGYKQPIKLNSSEDMAIYDSLGNT